MEEQLMPAREQLRKLMYDDAGQVARLLTSVEAATGVAREHVVLTVVGTLAVYLIVGDRAQLLCNAICFIIPAIISYKALGANDSSKFGQLIVYWMAYAALIIVDLAIVACDGHCCFPFYWLIKTIVLLLLLLFSDGAQRIYDHFVSSAVEVNEPEEAVHQEQPITNEPEPDKFESAKLTTIAEQSREPKPPSPPATVEKLEEPAPVEEQQEEPAPVEEQQVEPAPVVEELTPQPTTEEQRLKAEEAEEIKAFMAEETLNEIRLLNKRRNQLIKEASVTITPTTNSVQTSRAESATQQSSTVEQQQTVAGEHCEKSVHSVRTTSQPTDGAESNATQSPPSEKPEPYVPTPPTSDSDVSLAMSRYAQHSLNDLSAPCDTNPTTAAASAEESASSSLNQTTVVSQALTDGDDLKLEPNATLVFNAPFADQTLVYHVRMTNTSSHPIGYAVKSNAIPRLMPDHGFGVLAPGEKVLLAVSSAPFIYHLEDTSKDRLAIEYMAVPVGVDDFGLDWFVHKKGNCFVKRKNLVVQYNA